VKKFQFKFETVLKVKEKKEEALKHELMKLQALKIEQKQLLARIDEEKNAMFREKGSEKERGTNIQQLQYFERYIAVLHHQIDLTNKKIAELEGRVVDKRHEVVEASREKKTFERLKEKHFTGFKKMVIDNEQKQLDEMAISKYNRKEQHYY
jgi:flagellar protein FliJ